MLIQSHEGYIKLLPALPEDWRCGSFAGLCARGGFSADVRWENGCVVSAELFSEKGGACRVVYPVMRGGERALADITVAVEAGGGVSLPVG